MSSKQLLRHSLLEATTNFVVGIILIVIIAQLMSDYSHVIREYIWAGFQFKINLQTNFYTTVFFAVFSTIKIFVIRRIFNRFS